MIQGLGLGSAKTAETKVNPSTGSSNEGPHCAVGTHEETHQTHQENKDQETDGGPELRWPRPLSPENSNANFEVESRGDSTRGRTWLRKLEQGCATVPEGPGGERVSERQEGRDKKGYDPNEWSQ